jgi:hypothetical protein
MTVRREGSSPVTRIRRIARIDAETAFSETATALIVKESFRAATECGVDDLNNFERIKTKRGRIAVVWQKRFFSR